LPKGMANPPQNPKVRAKLLQDLQNFSVALSPPEWPPQQRPHQEEVRRAPELSRSMGDLLGSYSSLISDGTYRVRKPWNQKGRRASSAPKPQIRPPKRLYGNGLTFPEESSQASGMGLINRTADVKRQSVGYTTGLWHNKVPGQEGDSAGSSSTLASPASKKAAGERKSSEKKEQWQAPGKERPDRILTELELRNARLVLRAQASLHSSAVQDRYRFAADTSPGANLVIQGAGTGWGNSAPPWASDASYLTQFHHSAIRIVNPSGLDPLKEETTKRKKKKKDDDDLQFSGSGLFQPKYPFDKSLRHLKMLKKKTYPEACRTEEELAAAAAAQNAADQAASFASSFKREVAEEPWPAAEA